MAKQRTPTATPEHIFESNKISEATAEADALFLSIGDGAIVTDARGRISRVNQVALDILGFEENDLIGEWYPGVIIAEDKNRNVLSNYTRPIAQVFLTGQKITQRIYYRRKDGSQVPAIITVAPVLVHGKPTGAIELLRDITDELALEQAKDDFISIASHQLRTPATGVKQYAGMLLEGYVQKLTPEQRALLSKAYESNERQLEIIDDLLKVARIDAGNIVLQIQKTDLIKVVNQVLAEYVGRIKSHNLSMEFTHPTRTLNAEIDEARIRMVLDNLIDNAIKYTHAGKKITINAYKLRDRAIVRIRDHGVGIAPEDIEKLFQKFQRIPNDLSVEAGGTGLGLYWAEKIVQLHDGRIQVSSKIDKGSSFSMNIPLKRSKKRTEN